MKKFLVLLLLSLVGCSRRQHVEKATFEKDDSENVVCILLDMSGSFQHFMTEEGKAYAFCLQICDRYFREKIGSNDKLVISIITGGERALLWEGSPLDLRKEFSPKKFREFLKANVDAAGSNVHSALIQTIRHALDHDAIAAGTAKAAVFCLSDMEDSGKNGSDLDDVLSEFAEKDGVIGLYYVTQGFCAPWKERLKDAGFKSSRFRVESSIVGRPKLPTF